MTLRYLFGPVPLEFAEQNLLGPRQAGACLAFNTEGTADVAVGATDNWDKVLGRLPPGWEPDYLVLSLAYANVPGCLWPAPLPRVAWSRDGPLPCHSSR